MQDKIREEGEAIADLLTDPATHVYICGLRGMEEGVAKAFDSIAEINGEAWSSLRDVMLAEGRYHVETY